MKIERTLLTELEKALKAERKRQKLSREEAAVELHPIVSH